MKITNKTQYDTRYLRRLFLACENHEGTNPKRRHVCVQPKSGGGVGGYAWYNSHSVVMKLSGVKADARDVAQVYIHEVGHNLGLRHKDMAACKDIQIDFWPDEAVPLKAAKPTKPKPSIVEQRAAKAEAKLTEWTKKLNRAKTYVKKYQRKVRYYQKRRAANQ
jgi:hypothetical protein